MVEKARAAGGGGQAIPLSDGACVCLIGIIARDLGLSDHFPELPRDLPTFFDQREPDSLTILDVEFLPLMERLVELNSDSDTFFACLANLHKRRLKYERILQTQPIPTIEQVGPRGLLQFGTMSASALTGLLFWRKWFFDVHNRAGRETGYLFEPIIAHAIGGVPFSAKASPVRRAGDSRKGRQVDCIRQQKAYEFQNPRDDSVVWTGALAGRTGFPSGLPTEPVYTCLGGPGCHAQSKARPAGGGVSPSTWRGI